MAEQCVVYSKQHEAVGRIDTLDLTAAILRDSIEEGTGPVLGCTLNDPEQLAGILGWGKITRAFRDRVVKKPHDWTREKHRNQPSTVSPDRKVAIVVAGGTSDTGIVDGHPATRSAKGPATQDAIDKNRRSFSEYEPSFAKFDPPKAAEQTWVLLYFIDEEAGEARAELSLPQQMAEDGHVSSWRERIILDPIQIERAVSVTTDELGTDDEQYNADVEPRLG